MEIIWHVEDCRERDWLRFLLAGSASGETDDYGYGLPVADAIHVVSGNTTPLRDLDGYFARCRRQLGPLILFQLSDEWFSGGYKVYRHFDLVLRTHHTRLADAPGIYTVPLGPPSDTQTISTSTLGSPRRYMWSFVGELKASRFEMLRAMRAVQPHLVVSPGRWDPDLPSLAKTEFDEVLDESAFLPCPMGNAMAETWRLYEGLERGCIPLVERRPFMDYYSNLFGSHPIPTFRSWGQARAYCIQLLNDRAALEWTQRELFTWWQDRKLATRRAVQTRIQDPRYNDSLRRYAARLPNRRRLLYEGLRLGELIRHQSPESLTRRLRNPGGAVRRILRESFSRDGSRKPMV